MRKIPRNVVWLGIVSFLTDLSSEMILPVILPLYMKSVLPPSIALPVIGLIEGVAEAVASLLKLVSGWLSDLLKRRKALVIAGYVVSACVKPLFAVASVWWHFLVIRFSERTGKGIRTAPRDALLAASVSPENRGISFGFHRALDTAGAFLGLLTALILVWALRMEPKDFKLLFFISFIPGILAVVVLAAAVRELAPPAKEKRSGPLVLTRPFIAYLIVIGIFTLGNSSDAFLVLRASDLFAGEGHAPERATLLVLCLMLAMNAVDAGLATWFGSLSDRLGRRNVLAFSFGIYALVYLGIALATQAWMLWALFALYGFYYAASHGAMTAFVADLVPDEGRGRAYGLFHTVVGIVALPASLIMGILYKILPKPQRMELAFVFGAALALIATVLLFVLVRSPKVTSHAEPTPNNAPGA